MSVLDEETTNRIKTLLKHHPKGMMISDLSRQVKINRNIMAKYLEILLIAGQVEMEMRGNAKVYTLSERAPLSQLFDSSSDCIILLDGKGTILWANSPAFAATSRTGNELIGKRIREIDDPFFAAIPFRDEPGGQMVKDISLVREGQAVYYRVKQVPAVLADGNTGSILTCENITPEVTFRQMADLSDTRFRAIVEDQTEFIVRFLPDGTLTFVNGSYARSVAKKPEELIGMSVFSPFLREDVPLVREQIQSLNPGHAVTTATYRVPLENGGMRQEQWTMRALFDNSKSAMEYQGVGRDITEQAEVGERLRRHTADMEFISRKAREFLELPAEADIYTAMANGLSEIVPGAAICLSSCNPASPVFTIRAVSGRGARETFQRITGKDIIGFSFTINDPAALEFMKFQNLHKAYGDLYHALFGQAPYLVCKQIEEALGLDEIDILGLVSRDQLLGCATIFPPERHSIPNPGLVEAFIQQSSLVLAWRRADEAVRRSEARFRAIVEDQTEFITRFLPDGSLTYVNRSYSRYLGQDPRALIGRQHIPYIVSEVIPLLQQRSQEPGQNDLVTTVQCRVMNPEGTRWQQWTVRALADEKGAVKEFQSVGRDITGIHEAEDSMRRHIADMEFLSRKARELLEFPAGADIYHAILDGLRELVPFATITVSSFNHRSGTITVRCFWSEDVGTIFRQLTGEDLIGKDFRVTDPDAIAAMSAGKIQRIPGDVYYTMFGEVPMAISQQLEQVLEITGDKYAVGLASREKLLGTVMIAPKKGKQLRHENLIEIYLHQASIALAQRLDADALRQSEEKFRAIIEDQTEFITRFAPDGTLIFVNAPLCKAAGTDQQDLVGRSFYSMIPEHDRKDLIAGLQALTSLHPKMEIRHRFIDPTGRTRWFQWTNRAIFDELGHIVEYDGIGRDVTDQHEAMTRIRHHPAEIRFLADHARALAEIRDPREILAFTTKNIRAILPHSLVGICSYSPALQTLSFHCLEGNPEDLGILNRELGHDPIGTALAFSASPEMQSLLSARQIAAAPGTIGLFISPQSRDICTRIEDRCNFGRSYVMGLPSSDGTIDSVLLQLKAGTDLQSPELVEAAISQAGLALARAQYQ